jgi:cell division protein ZapA
VEANILGRTFRIGCTPEEEAQVREAVDYLDAKMREIRDSGKVVGHERARAAHAAPGGRF